MISKCLVKMFEIEEGGFIDFEGGLKIAQIQKQTVKQQIYKVKKRQKGRIRHKDQRMVVGWERLTLTAHDSVKKEQNLSSCFNHDKAPLSSQAGSLLKQSPFQCQKISNFILYNMNNLKIQMNYFLSIFCSFHRATSVTMVPT